MARLSIHSPKGTHRNTGNTEQDRQKAASTNSCLVSQPFLPVQGKGPSVEKCRNAKLIVAAAWTCALREELALEPCFPHLLALPNQWCLFNSLHFRTSQMYICVHIYLYTHTHTQIHEPTHIANPVSSVNDLKHSIYPVDPWDPLVSNIAIYLCQ